MDVRKIIQEEVRKVFKEYLDFEPEDEFPRIMKGPRGYMLGMASMGAGDKEYPRSVESPYYKTPEEVCKFYATWNPSMATMQEAIRPESSNQIVIVGDPEEICSVSENYPAGAQYDSRAPWNQKDPTPGKKADERKLNLLFSDDSEFAFFEDKSGNKYVFYIDSVDSSEFSEYADREETFHGYDEDGDPDVEYGDWEMDSDIVDNYVNDNVDSMKIGKGLDAYESGDYDLVIIDDELRDDLKTMAKYYKDGKGEEFLKALGATVDESMVDKIATQKTMDTPTGTLFVMDVGTSE